MMPVLEIPKAKLAAGLLAMAINHDRPNQCLEEKVTTCLAQAMDLVKPRAVYELLKVTEQGPDWIELSGEDDQRARLTVGPGMSMLRQAKMALVGVTSIGPELEKEVKRLNRQGEYYDGYVLDCVGIALLSEAGKALDRLAAECAAQRGWGLSYRLAPGSTDGWEISDQKALTSLLALQQISLSLSEQNVLWPFKSASSFIGMGPGYTQRRVKTLCHMCRKNEMCWVKGRDFYIGDEGRE